MFDRASPINPLRPHEFSIAEVQDRLALQHLVSAYGHAIDRRDYALVRALYHDDAIDDHSPYYCGSATGYVEWLPTMMANWSATSHTMFSMVFVVDGESAEGVISARAWHRTLDGARDFLAWGRYADRYEKRHGIWRFARRFFVLDAVEEGPAATGDFGTEGVETGRAGGDDPIYRRLPLFGALRGMGN